ncbi:MAG: phage tail sheath subtilisin-like domain-containing protein [Pseudomonadota bacterium]
MPEYRAPGVYVEEVNTGTRPIEGVSTSTTGLVGCTEFGPEDTPVLITGVGDFRRVFGDPLDFDGFTSPDGNVHAYLPHAVEGYFTNGGRRAYLTRVLPDGASHADRMLFDRAQAGDAASVLLRDVPQGSGTAVDPPALYALDPGGVADGDWLRVGDGSRAEYRQVAVGGVSAGEAHLTLSTPLHNSHAPGVSIEELTRTPDAVTFPNTGGVMSLAAAAQRGATEIVVDAGGDAAALTGLATVSVVLELGAAAATAQYARATAAATAGGTLVRLTLSGPLAFGHDDATPVTALDPTTLGAASDTLALAANAGELIVATDPAGFIVGTLVVIDSAGAGPEVRRLGQLSTIDLDVPAYASYPFGTLASAVTVADDERTVTAVAPQSIDLDDVASLDVGQEIAFGGDPTNTAIIAAVDETLSRITLQADPPLGVAVGDAASPSAKRLTGAIASGGIVLSLDNRLGLAAGDVLRVGADPEAEYVTVAEIVDPRSAAPDAGAVVLTAPVREAHAAGAEVRRQHAPTPVAGRQDLVLALATAEAGTELLTSDGSNPATPYLQDEFISITLASGDVHYHRLAADAADASPREILLTEALALSHEAGQPVAERRPLLQVRALDRGSAGNRLLIAINDEPEGLASRARLTSIAAPLELHLNTLTGVEAGTLLELLDAQTGAPVGDPLKVRRIDRAANNLVELDGPGLSAAQVAAHNTALLGGQQLGVRSREFALTVFLLDRPHPAIPSRNAQVRDSETFRHLSMDHRHRHYVHRILGTTWTPPNETDDDGVALRLWDRRSEGESRYIRVRDTAADAAEAEAVRLGPEALTDTLPSGLERPARHPADGGADSPATMGDAMYVGVDDDEPQLRTGLYSLRSVRDISIVAIPGQSSVTVQQALIDHCERDAYRFAVLDAHGPNDDNLVAVQEQRQQFDTSYGAVYHPWLTIAEPLPQNLANIRQVPIPPSGHVSGIYARTDNDRGVHKAPANVVVRGITGLQRTINRGEQEIINPRGINVTADFRDANRALRVWGARTMSSDTAYRYVSVRRLMIFLENSLDQGLQWVVFEPNAEDTWARVRRTITNFLTVVWRNGALEGATVEEAFFVRCDRSTMTQTDIDNGRLIAEVGVAPVRPAEFVIIRIGQWTANADS